MTVRSRSKKIDFRHSRNLSKSIPTSLEPLKKLVGTWNVTIKWSEETHKLAGGPPVIEAEANISWLKVSGFLHYQLGPSHWVIGRDDSAHEYTILYSDDRLVSRVYRMSFDGTIWKIWREAPGFYQRFEGRVQKNRRRIDANWEKSEDDGRTWKHDFSMIFERSG